VGSFPRDMRHVLRECVVMLIGTDTQQWFPHCAAQNPKYPQSMRGHIP